MMRNETRSLYQFLLTIRNGLAGLATKSNHPVTKANIAALAALIYKFAGQSSTDIDIKKLPEIDKKKLYAKINADLDPAGTFSTFVAEIQQLFGKFSTSEKKYLEPAMTDSLSYAQSIHTKLVEKKTNSLANKDVIIFKLLPKELWGEIFKQLGGKGMAIFAQTSTTGNSLVSTDQFWKGAIEKDFNVKVERNPNNISYREIYHELMRKMLERIYIPIEVSDNSIVAFFANNTSKELSKLIFRSTMPKNLFYTSLKDAAVGLIMKTYNGGVQFYLALSCTKEHAIALIQNRQYEKLAEQIDSVIPLDCKSINDPRISKVTVKEGKLCLSDGIDKLQISKI